MNIQPILENENVKLVPLTQTDFEELFVVFENFFQGAMESEGAFKIIDKESNEIAGSTRFYDYSPEDNSIFIGYTFYGTKFWGSKLNPQVKKLMLDYIFQFVDKVNFHVGKDNIRSQKAMEKLGAKKVDEVNVAYAYEPERLNVVFEIKKENYYKLEAV